MQLATWPVIALWILLVVAGMWDLVKLRIPNLLVAAILVLFAVYAATNWETIPILMHIASGVIVLAAGMLMFAKGMWGGGDAKLAFVSALWVPLTDLPWWTLATALIGGALAIALVTLRRLVPDPMAAKLPMALRKRGPIPYGIAIAAGTIIAVS